ncbi:BA14K family protein [Mesorhizobium sp. NBSH29]|uniref:BA14K family protein n=1 Tax=Mesorhizobium sp. NBSH29 TaxID=2654249 RepID=UPI001896A316|nr:BA14K family protein [Mesorhizobium sp. NBSH29]QPC87656.1 BA14K family protein [Mesorhizobium sp. NBSH29]
MSFKRTFATALFALSLSVGALASSSQSSQAAGLTPGEAAALAGVGGFIIGATIGGGPGYVDDGYYYRPHHGRAYGWERHVRRCYARYRSYDHRSDTFVDRHGYERRCRL